MAPPIPDRWIPYKACGKVIEGTRIICFKVPLRNAVQVNKSDIKEIWDIKALLESIPKLGAVIDLTNTNRYYSPEKLKKAGIHHQKILMPGRIIPPEDKVQLFMDTVDEFLGMDCEFLVGVHCTHGLNRTGYMVCRYMRDRLNIPAKTAIKRFEKARGYQIERANYIADLLGEVPPPADLNFKKKDRTKIKPVNDRNMDPRPSRADRDEDDQRRDKYLKNKSWTKNDGKDNGKVDNWRSELRSSVGDNNRKDTWTSWSKNKGESSSKSKKRRTDSERSYDYKYDY